MIIKNNQKILIYSLGINSYGGKHILKFILDKFKDHELFLISDSRLKVKNEKIIENQFFKNNLFSLLYFNLFYNKDKFDYVFFVNGLPPLFNFSTKHFVFFQNANILNFKYDLKWIFSKNIFRYFYFHFFKKNTSNWIVFNQYTKNILFRKIAKKNKIDIINFYFHTNLKKNNKIKKVFDLFYPASGDPHKNHNLLFDSLVLLSKKNIYPKILITLNDYHYNKLKVSSLIKIYNLKITNKYFNREDEIYLAYQKSRALIFPSLNETLGIPLYEASFFKCKILMSNKLKIYKSTNNDLYFFNPFSNKSISNAILKIYNE